MVKINPYLMVKNGKEAIELYKDLFGAKVIDQMPFEKEAGAYFGFPDDFDYENSTMHVVLDIEGATVMLSDNPMGKPGSGNVQVLVTVESEDEIEKINEKVQKNKFTIVMPLEKTDWGSWYMMFEDSNGVGWQINFPVEQ
ncbi:MAG: glyoxalase/bleomycin resistance/extradiol dioxygenase family protein [Candidatus Lokiarchaeota archaeon]|nr:glyoxalase/bleomycin resistance/extradiol dioxygenase family protein [Candidatus Lokiarchaeota archaeon]